MEQVIIIGGGAAGFFAAINIAETNADLKVTILEKGNKVLQKVKVSGGGRCNVSHACFDPGELVTYYPRGEKELLGPFHTFMTGDMMQWLEERGVPLKIESDQRIFPESNSSQTIIDCFVDAAKNAGVEVLLNQNVEGIEKKETQFHLSTKSKVLLADKLLICSGGNPKIWKMIKGLGHRIIDPVPSLFTFNIKDQVIQDIPGISVPNANVSIEGSRFESSGPLLITHWGLSGPAVLKLSSLNAVYLSGKEYNFTVHINWLGLPFAAVLDHIKTHKKNAPKKTIYLRSIFEEIPKRLWVKLLQSIEINENQTWSNISNLQLEKLTEKLTNTVLLSHGKTTFKEEFVTAGGVDLKEINFKRFESRIHSNLFFAGEVLNIDGLTGGFNFQNAWTGAYLAAMAIAGKMS